MDVSGSVWQAFLLPLGGTWVGGKARLPVLLEGGASPTFVFGQMTCREQVEQVSPSGRAEALLRRPRRGSALVETLSAHVRASLCPVPSLRVRCNKLPVSRACCEKREDAVKVLSPAPHVI